MLEKGGWVEAEHWVGKACVLCFYWSYRISAYIALCMLVICSFPTIISDSVEGKHNSLLNRLGVRASTTPSTVYWLSSNVLLGIYNYQVTVSIGGGIGVRATCLSLTLYDFSNWKIPWHFDYSTLCKQHHKDVYAPTHRPSHVQPQPKDIPISLRPLHTP
jgi:hypothetical protein